VLLAACGGEDEPDAAGADSADRSSLSIAEPADGAEVEVPFTVRFSSDVDLGPIDSGASHVHIWIDGKEDDYEVVEGDSYEIEGLAAGEHTISVSLRNADHSAAGSEDEISVVVSDTNGSG